MNWKFASAVSAFACFVAGGWLGFSFAARAKTKPIVFTTAAKQVTAKLQSKDGSTTVQGRASLTVTAANGDDTLTGTLVYALPDDARHKIAQATGKGLNDIRSAVAVKDVTASFSAGTACPLIKLEVAIKEAEVGGVKLNFDRVVLEIQETPEQMNQLFCTWTRQINAKRQRLGVIAAINRLIQPVD